MLNTEIIIKTPPPTPNNFNQGDIVTESHSPNNRIFMVTNIISDDRFQIITLRSNYHHCPQGEIYQDSIRGYVLFNGSITLSNQ